MMLYEVERVIAETIAVTTLAFALGTSTCHAVELPKRPTPGAWKYGSEVDALPFVMRGYYGSAFAGRNGSRLRVVVARSDIPSFLVTDGFKDKISDAYALLADRFFGARRQQMQGTWVGVGSEYWRNSIRPDASPVVAHYNNVMLTAGGGYVFRVARHVYINPWAGGHLVVAGDRSIPVSGKTYTQPLFTAEASVKLGFVF